jgi:hypothetical protein
VLVVLVVVVGLYGGIKALVSQTTATSRGIATTQPSVTASTTPTPQDIYNQATSGTPVLDDSLSTNATNSWAETNDSNGACLFTAGAYHAIIRPAFSGGIACFYNSTHFSNLAYQVEMTIIKGDGGGELLFRTGGGPDPTGWGYQFGLLQDHVGLWYAGTTFSSSTAIKAKLNQTYLLTAIARGNTINVYLDKQWVGSAVDNTASSGGIGLAVHGQANFTEVAFRNVKVWKLP